jgi:hypothetical protein
MDNSQPGPAVSGVVVTSTPVRRLAVAADLERFKGQLRIHTESDLRGYLTWCETRGLIRWPSPDRTSTSTSGGVFDCEVPSGRCAEVGPLVPTGGDPMFIGNDM